MVIALCHSDHSARCEHPYYRDRVEPGHSAAENISPDLRTEWAVEREDGALLRCVVLYWKHYPGQDQRLSLSTAPEWAWPCPRVTQAFGVHGAAAGKTVELDSDDRDAAVRLSYQPVTAPGPLSGVLAKPDDARERS